MRVDVDLRQFRELAARFAELNDRSLLYAMRNTLNAVAFDARKEWVKRAARTFTLRNRYTERSLRVDKVRTQKLAEMESRVGSVLPYMATQEEGGQETAKGKHGVAIPTSSAAGQARKTRPRTRTVRPKNYLEAIHLAKGVGGSRQRRNAVAIKLARERTNGVAFLDLGRRKGLFAISSSKRAKPRMLYDLSRKTTRLRPHRTLEPTVRTVSPRVLLHAERAISYELARLAAKRL